MNKISAIVMFFLVLCVSCTARIQGSIQNDGQADLHINAALEPRMTMLLTGLAAASGAMEPGTLLNGPAIAATMATAPGIASISFENTAPAAIEGPVKITKMGEFLANRRTGGFIRFIQNFPAGGRCTVNINLKSGPEILALISPDVTVYLEALMAPLATGERLTKKQYLELVGSVYGKAIADEISKAVIRASIDFPGPVTSAKGGSYSGKRVEYTIPLLDLLVLETPLSYEIAWR